MILKKNRRYFKNIINKKSDYLNKKKNKLQNLNNVNQKILKVINEN